MQEYSTMWQRHIQGEVWLKTFAVWEEQVSVWVGDSTYYFCKGELRGEVGVDHQYIFTPTAFRNASAWCE